MNRTWPTPSTPALAFAYGPWLLALVAYATGLAVLGPHLAW